jgi:L-threonylcarbamoyladenylate synthase
LESTIVSCLEGAVRLLRPGGIRLSQLRAIVGNVEIGADSSTPRVPGSAAAHYSPSTPLTLVPSGELDGLAGAQSEGGQRIAVLAQRLPLKTYETVTWINAGKRAEAFGHDLYANLRTLDKAGCARILVQEVPDDERWDAIRDRLVRAAAATVATDSGRYASLETGVLP